MIEEILEKSFNVTTDLNITDTVVRLQDVLVILDKHNQPDYKSAFDEIFEKSHYKNITMEDMIDFSKKYNLGSGE